MNGGDPFNDLDGTYTFGNAPPDFVQLEFADQNARFRSVTVNNQSSRLCAVYLNSGGSGTPVFTILPGSFTTQPVASSEYLSLRFFAQKGGVDTGTIYVHACTTPLSASSGIAAASSSSGIVFNYSTFDTGAAFSQ